MSESHDFDTIFTIFKNIHLGIPAWSEVPRVGLKKFFNAGFVFLAFFYPIYVKIIRFCHYFDDFQKKSILASLRGRGVLDIRIEVNNRKNSNGFVLLA